VVAIVPFYRPTRSRLCSRASDRSYRTLAR